MNVVISDTAEYGNYLFTHAAVPLLKDFVNKLSVEDLGNGMREESIHVDNQELIKVNESIRNHPVEIIGKKASRLHDTNEKFSTRLVNSFFKLRATNLQKRFD